MEIRFIDLFAGCGGLSEGFSAEGMTAVAHVEMKKEACQTIETRECFRYLKNHGKINDYYAFLKGEKTREELLGMIPAKEYRNVLCREMSEDNVEQIVSEIKTLSKGKPINVVVGGPPCQAYSLAGRSRKGPSIVNDPRNYFYKIYFRFIEAFEPSFFVFENVAGIKTAGKGEYFLDIENVAKQKGYSIEPRIICARDYGVLQKRNRMIIFGYKEGFEAGKNAFWKSMEEQSEKLRQDYSSFKVSDLLCDLAPLRAGQFSKEYLSEPTDYLLKSGIRANSSIPLSWHVSRPNRKSDLKIYRLAVNGYQSGHQIKYTDLPRELQFHKNRSSFLDRFKVVEGNDSSCHTMVAHISKDGHYYIHPDAEQNRSLSVREAARIQSFPDDYYFEGSRTAAFTQVGNAVPPLLSKAMAIATKEAFFKIK